MVDLQEQVPGAVTQAGCETGMRLKAFAKSGVEVSPAPGEATT